MVQEIRGFYQLMADHIDPLKGCLGTVIRLEIRIRLPPEILRRLRTLDAPAILIDEWVTVKRILMRKVRIAEWMCLRRASEYGFKCLRN